jgi:PilZ domain
MLRLGEERRRATRYRLVAPVHFKDGSMGQVLDMSKRGVLFETEKSFAVGETIRFCVMVNDSTVRCAGRVLRVELLKHAFRIAVVLQGYDFV